MMGGVFLITREKGNPAGEKKYGQEQAKGILLSLGAALCWGISPVLTKPAVALAGSAAVGNLISYVAGGLGISFF